jgi:hypothetical protein
MKLCGGEQENNMKGLASERASYKPCIKSHKSVIFHVVVEGGIPGAISMKFGPLVHIVNVINSAKFDYCNSVGLALARV